VYLAELKGKLTSKLTKSEDLLTSNVFSFFKYSDRQKYLGEFLNKLRIPCTQTELEEAEFHFWPKYQEGTEPDVVLITQNYYILFEAKYGADFSNEFLDRKAQLEREYNMGLIEATNLNKQFLLVVITADYNYPIAKFISVQSIVQGINFRWINWQFVSELLMLNLVQQTSKTPELLFAQDLLDLLDKKHLRNFISFQYLSFHYESPKKVFFSYDTANYRGAFIGFSKSLKNIPKIKKQDNIFYKKFFFSKLPNVHDPKPSNKYIFFRRS
jgi:hypothetical protein